MLFTSQFITAFCLDLLFGDPRFLPHPVRGIGWLCSRYEKLSRTLSSNASMAGAVCFFLVLLTTLAAVGLVLIVIHRVSPILEYVAAIITLYFAFACRDLINHSKLVYTALVNDEELDVARQYLAQIVGRDTAELDRSSICRATVETVAENLVDGILSPIFFAVIVSCLAPNQYLSPISMAALGAFGYKAINTMDSMYGYKNSLYRYFGTFAAKTDDLANWLPARMSGFLLVLSAFLLNLDGRAGLRIFVRDRLQHASPNGGHPEAAVAGCLGIQLGGGASYFGTTIDKPTMGDALRPVGPGDILATNRLMLVSSILFLLVLLGLRYLLLEV